LDVVVEGTPWRVSFVVAMVAIVGTIFVSTRRTTAPRMMAVMTDKALTAMSVARKRWDTTAPSECSNKN
jgi:hypothetical protein